MSWAAQTARKADAIENKNRGCDEVQCRGGGVARASGFVGEGGVLPRIQGPRSICRLVAVRQIPRRLGGGLVLAGAALSNLGPTQAACLGQRRQRSSCDNKHLQPSSPACRPSQSSPSVSHPHRRAPNTPRHVGQVREGVGQDCDCRCRRPRRPQGRQARRSGPRCRRGSDPWRRRQWLSPGAHILHAPPIRDLHR